MIAAWCMLGLMIYIFVGAACYTALDNQQFVIRKWHDEVVCADARAYLVFWFAWPVLVFIFARDKYGNSES